MQHLKVLWHRRDAEWRIFLGMNHSFKTIRRIIIPGPSTSLNLVLSVYSLRNPRTGLYIKKDTEWQAFETESAKRHDEYGLAQQPCWCSTLSVG